jgi:hypothetical protein
VAEPLRRHELLVQHLFLASSVKPMGWERQSTLLPHLVLLLDSEESGQQCFCALRTTFEQTTERYGYPKATFTSVGVRVLAQIQTPTDPRKAIPPPHAMLPSCIPLAVAGLYMCVQVVVSAASSCSPNPWQKMRGNKHNPAQPSTPLSIKNRIRLVKSMIPATGLLKRQSNMQGWYINHLSTLR